MLYVSAKRDTLNFGDSDPHEPEVPNPAVTIIHFSGLFRFPRPRLALRRSISILDQKRGQIALSVCYLTGDQ